LHRHLADLASSLRSSTRQLLRSIEALETLSGGTAEPERTPEEEARIIEHLVESFEKQLIRDLDAGLEEHPGRQRESALNLSFHWSVRAAIFREVWSATRRTRRHRIAEAELSAEAKARLRARLHGRHSVFLVRPDSLRRIN
jgi:hypothetical protein